MTELLQNGLLKNNTSVELGREAETFAANMLIEHGLHLIEKNVNFRVGELDLVMKDKDSLVFVEVKRRNSNKFGGAIGSITAVKQKRLTKAALAYLQRKKLMDKVPCRFDLVAVTDTNGLLEAQWIKNIF
ncbi:MAG: putative endonuclease [Enterobacterales bacterium]|jgi:putative endonuclease